MNSQYSISWVLGKCSHTEDDGRADEGSDKAWLFASIRRWLCISNSKRGGRGNWARCSDSIFVRATYSALSVWISLCLHDARFVRQRRRAVVMEAKTSEPTQEEGEQEHKERLSFHRPF